jgi:hypothetical protein
VAVDHVGKFSCGPLPGPPGHKKVLLRPCRAVASDPVALVVY